MSAVTKDGKVKELTPRHMALIKASQDKWMARMRETTPVDREAVNAVLKSLPNTPRVVWLESPVQLVRRVFDLEHMFLTRAQVAPAWVEGDSSSLPSMRRPASAQLHKALWKVGVSPNARSIAISTQASIFGKVATGRVIEQVQNLLVDALVPSNSRGRVSATIGLDQYVRDMISMTDNNQVPRENLTPQSVNELAGRAAYCEFMRDVFKADTVMEDSAIDFAWAAAGCYFYVLEDSQILICERPSAFSFDDQQRVHASLGPAVEWPNGCGFCAWHGQPVPVWAFLPGQLTAARIQKEGNPDTRAALIDMLGIGTYLDAVGARLVCTDMVEVARGDGNFMPRAVLEFGGRYYLEGCDGSTDRTYFMPVTGPALGWPRNEKELLTRVADAEKSYTCADAHRSICGLNEQFCLAQS